MGKSLELPLSQRIRYGKDQPYGTGRIGPQIGIEESGFREIFP